MKKTTLFIYLFLLCLSNAWAGSSYRSQDDKKIQSNDTLPFTWERFISQPNVNKLESTAFVLYQMGDRYALEIPYKALEKDVLVTAQVVSGSSYVSPSSDVVRFIPGSNIHSLYLQKNRSLDAQSDSTDHLLAESIETSNLQPIDMAFSVLSRGQDGKSYIIDITNEVNGNGQLFNMSGNNYLSHPDPARSGLTDLHAVNNGIAIGVYRSQTDMLNTQSMDTKTEVASTLGVEFIIQLLPEHKQRMKLNNPFYGFETISRQEYDSKTYVSRRRDYICRWNLKDLQEIVVNMDPLIPSQYAASLKSAFETWASELSALGYKKVFRFTNNAEESGLQYGHIDVRWGSAVLGFNSNKVINPITGEIVTARMNVSDMPIDDQIKLYYTQCRHTDKRIMKDIENLNVRKDIFTSMALMEIGHILGIKENASVRSGFTFNYAITSSVSDASRTLMPQITKYEREALAYVYGKRTQEPSDSRDYFSSIDPQKEYLAPKMTLGHDWLTTSRKGIEQCPALYSSLISDMKKLPLDQNSYESIHNMAMLTLANYQQYVTNITKIIGKCQTLPVKKGVNLKPYRYSSREEQIAALNYLEKEILTTTPKWASDKTVLPYLSNDPDEMMRGTTVSLYKILLDKDVIDNLISAEEQLGNKTFTAKELFAFIDRVLFDDFNESKSLPEFKRLLQSNIVPDLATKVFQSDISLGMGNEGATMLHDYFIKVAKKVNYLAEKHPDKETRENYELIKMRLDREYFNKQH